MNHFTVQSFLIAATLSAPDENILQHVVSTGKSLPQSVERFVFEDILNAGSISMQETYTTNAHWDRVHFEQAVRPHLSGFYRYCVALSADHDAADDVFQNVLTKAFVNFASFSGQGMAHWLRSMARYEHLEARRTYVRQRVLLERATDLWMRWTGQSPADAEMQVQQKESHACLLRCLNALPVAQREVIFLCDIEELGYERVASFLKLPVGTVKSRHARAREKLKTVFERQGRILNEMLWGEEVSS